MFSFFCWRSCRSLSSSSSSSSFHYISYTHTHCVVWLFIIRETSVAISMEWNDITKKQKCFSSLIYCWKSIGSSHTAAAEDRRKKMKMRGIVCQPHIHMEALSHTHMNKKPKSYIIPSFPSKLRHLQWKIITCTLHRSQVYTSHNGTHIVHSHQHLLHGTSNSRTHYYTIWLSRHTCRQAAQTYIEWIGQSVPRHVPSVHRICVARQFSIAF